MTKEQQTEFTAFITDPKYISLIVEQKKCKISEAVSHLADVYKKAENCECPEEESKAIAAVDQIRNTEPVKLVVEQSKPVDESVHALPPCGECGGTTFIPTGTCHACATCGASQGCS